MTENSTVYVPCVYPRTMDLETPNTRKSTVWMPEETSSDAVVFGISDDRSRPNEHDHLGKHCTPGWPWDETKIKMS